jgi:FixJ family two-component response regulator
MWSPLDPHQSKFNEIRNAHCLKRDDRIGVTPYFPYRFRHVLEGSMSGRRPLAMNDGANAKTVFIVDDDEAVRDSLSILLDAYGLGVEAFDSVAAFKHALGAKRGACLILDQHMPVTTGLEFLASSEGQDLGMPVILVTAHNDKEIRAQANEAGVFAFLAKPVDGDALMAAVTSAIARSRAMKYTEQR